MLTHIEPLTKRRQGCSKASIGAAVLDNVLRSCTITHEGQLPSIFSRSFFREHTDKVAARCWDSGKPVGKFRRGVLSNYVQG